MKSVWRAALVAAGLVTAASAQTTSAEVWKAVFVGDSKPKVPAYIQFEIQRFDRGVVGTVHADKWPGDGVISDATIDGDHVMFTTIMEHGSWGTISGGVRVEHCCPKLLFDGRIDGDRMALTGKWTSTEAAGAPGSTYSMLATRVSR